MFQSQSKHTIKPSDRPTGRSKKAGCVGIAGKSGAAGRARGNKYQIWFPSYNKCVAKNKKRISASFFVLGLDVNLYVSKNLHSKNII